MIYGEAALERAVFFFVLRWITAKQIDVCHPDNYAIMRTMNRDAHNKLCAYVKIKVWGKFD